MRTFKAIPKYFAVLLISLLSLFPFYVLLYLSLTAPTQSFFESFRFMPDFHFANYVEAWKTSRIGYAIINSLIITAGSLTVVVFFASAAGYSIARFNTKLNSSIFNILLVCLTIPAIIITVPLYSLMKSIGGINSLWAMILLTACNAMPFAVFLYSSFIKILPREVEESAIMDGCTFFSAFWRVTFHFLKPVNAAVIILSGLGIWNNYGQAVFFLQSRSLYTVPLAVGMFFQKYGAQWNLMAAAAVIGMAPAVLAFLIFQRFFIKGITAGALKG
jgi:raffinose/stachyose/melibiose transport system permease protein